MTAFRACADSSRPSRSTRINVGMPLRLTLAVGTVPVVPVVPVVSVVVWWMMDDGWSWLAGLRVGGVGVWYGGMVVWWYI